MKNWLSGLVMSLLTSACVQADHTPFARAEMRGLVGSGEGRSMGVILARQSTAGVIFMPALRGLPPGELGFHVHEHGRCGRGIGGAPGGAAGGHWNPRNPSSTATSHIALEHAPLGDLPPLQADAQGRATAPVLGSRIRATRELGGKALMIHNSSGSPIACGVIAIASTGGK